MNSDLRIINAGVSKIQGDCKNSQSQFCQDEAFRNQEIARIDTAIKALKDQHIGQDLRDLSALEASWERFKSNISEVGLLGDIKNKILSLARILAPSNREAGSATAAADPDVQATMEADEEAQTERLKVLKDQLPQNKPNLFNSICSLARSIADEKYGKAIKEACREQHPSVVYKDAFLRLLLIEKSMNQPIPHSQHEMEWDISEDALERLNRLQEEIKAISTEERISLLQKISSLEEEVPLTENEKKLFDSLNEAIQLLNLTKDEDLIYPQLLYERVEKLEKVSASYQRVFRLVQQKSKTALERATFLQKRIVKLGSADPTRFFSAIDQTLSWLSEIKNPVEVQPIIQRLLLCLKENLEEDPQIMKTFSKNSLLWRYFYDGMKEEEPDLNPTSVQFCMLMIPTLMEENPDLALKLTKKVVEFAKKPEEEFTMPPEFMQEVIKHQPHLAVDVIPYLSRQDVAQYFIQKVHAAKETGREAEIPKLLDQCRFEAQLFMKEILFAYWNASLRQASKESADLAKLKIRQFLTYFRWELREFLPGRSAADIEFDLLRKCLENSELSSSINLLSILLIPELARLGKKEIALEITNKFFMMVNVEDAASKSRRRLAYALLKASGLRWRSLDEVAFGPLAEPENAGHHPLDLDFTALYLEFMRSLQDPGLYIGDIIDLSRSLDQLAREFRNDSYREFSVQVIDLLKEILPKASDQLSASKDSLRKAKTLSRLVVGFSLIGEINRVMPTARRTLDEILLSDFPEEQFLPMLKMLTSNLVSSIKILHKKPASAEIQALKAGLIEVVFESVAKIQDVEDRIEVLFEIYDRLEVELDQDNDFYGGLCEAVLNQALTDVIGWDARGEVIKEKIQTLEELLELAEDFYEDLALAVVTQLEEARMNFIDYEHMQTELSEFETRDDIDPAEKIKKCIELINQGQDSNTHSRIVTIYAGAIDQVESPRKEELRAEMDAALAGSGRTSPEDED